MAKPLNIFISYAHEDAKAREEIGKHLKILQRLRKIAPWTDLEIQGGHEWEKEILNALAEADIILLLISPDFLNSDFIYEVELKKAIQRHIDGKSRVIPVVIRPCEWFQLPIFLAPEAPGGQEIEFSLGKLNALPRFGEPVESEKFPNKDTAYHQIGKGISDVVEDLRRKL